MKTTLHTALCVLLALALVAFGVLYGTGQGFREKRAEVEGLLWSENGLSTVLSYRGADGLNLYAVASRYLPKEDQHMVSLKAVGQNLAFHADQRLAMELFAQDGELSALVQIISNDLRGMPEFVGSGRDPQYLDMLMADMNSLSSNAAVATYNRHAAEFNAELDTPFGRLAQWMGVWPIELYE